MVAPVAVSCLRDEVRAESGRRSLSVHILIPSSEATQLPFYHAPICQHHLPVHWCSHGRQTQCPLWVNSGSQGQPRECLLRGAASTGRCNTSVESLCRRFKLQRFAWPFVELTRHLVQVCLRVYGQVGSLGEVLSEQAIGVLVGTPLPRALRIAEVNVDVCRHAEPAMIREFLAAVPGQGFVEFGRKLLGLPDERNVRCGSTAEVRDSHVNVCFGVIADIANRLGEQRAVTVFSINSLLPILDIAMRKAVP